MSRPRILLVEDDTKWLDIYRRGLGEVNYEITAAQEFGDGLALLKEQSFNLVITDLKMLVDGEEKFAGFGVLEQARAVNPDTQVIVITGYGSEDRAIQAMRNGAYDYIVKNKNLYKKLRLTVQSALETQALKWELLDSKPPDDVELKSDRIIGNSAKMKALSQQITRAAQSDINILIYGEGGTGKRLIAQTIHLQSRRRGGPFLVVDCGRLSESLVESELFGYEARSFYSGNEGRLGKFEQAAGGTIFLDGIGDLDMRLQTRLWGAVCDRVVERVGGQKPVPVNVRVIASTDKDLPAMVSVKQFDRRLFDALNEFVISVPPLRERKDSDDIPTLAAMFLQRHGNNRQVSFSLETVALLRGYDYPGNVRELESVVKNALAITEGEIIEPEHLRPEIRNYRPSEPDEDTKPNPILCICPLNLGACSKKEEIFRLYKSRRVFVNVPYLPEYVEYEHVIRHTLERYGLVPVLSKDYLEPVVLLCNICKLIQTCKYGIADISFSGTNVLYELGLMHAVGVHCAILKDRRAKQSTDIQGLFFLEYTNTASMGERLSRWIEDQVKEAKPNRPEATLSPDTSFDERNALKRELIVHQENLNELNIQAAKYGIDKPLHLLNAIRDEEKNIQRLVEKLNKL